MKIYKTYKGAASTYCWPEYRLRQWGKQGLLPGYYAGSRFYIDCEKLQEQLEQYGRPMGNGAGTSAAV